MQNFRSYLTGLSSLSILALIFTLTLSACGFQLRGAADLSFKNLYIQGSKLTISKDLKRTFDTNGIKVVDNAESADLLLEMLGESYEKRILSLSGDGLVREFELNYRVNFRTRTSTEPLWSQEQTVRSRRDFSYNDNALLGKADEEARLNADMRNDAIREILRRLSAIKPLVNSAAAN
ncbi:MAG TPA: LPS assembly lipoprotein LptE [Methylotenera sp.]|nr:LPS assembly lipoprotein LptE [Methylotenera sp.]